MNTEWSNDDIDRIFAAVTAAVLGDGSVEGLVRTINEVNAVSVWPDVVLEDILDAEYIDED